MCSHPVDSEASIETDGSLRRAKGDLSVLNLNRAVNPRSPDYGLAMFVIVRRC
jgi:hypothetical protein